MDIESPYKLIENELEKEAIDKFDSKEEYIIWNQEIYKKYKHKVYGLKVPEIEKIVNKYYNRFLEISFEEKINLARMFYTSEYIAQTSFGLKILEISLSKLMPQRFEILDEIGGYLSDWGPTDSFSLHIMQPLLRKYPNEVIELLTNWNNSNHTLKKRSSLVTFTRKIGAEGQYVDTLLEFCNNLIWHKEDLVRKAIGWALKDNMVGKNKEKVLNYVKDLRKKGVSSTITIYAIRNLKGKEREEILKIKSMK
jgi:3-methyladenine DNA glycosylase AlkD